MRKGPQVQCNQCGGGTTRKHLQAFGLCRRCVHHPQLQTPNRYRNQHEKDRIIAGFMAELVRHGSLRALREAYEARPRGELLLARFLKARDNSRKTGAELPGRRRLTDEERRRYKDLKMRDHTRRAVLRGLRPQWRDPEHRA
jgi:hypothetical protein